MKSPSTHRPARGPATKACYVGILASALAVAAACGMNDDKTDPDDAAEKVRATIKGADAGQAYPQGLRLQLLPDAQGTTALALQDAPPPPPEDGASGAGTEGGEPPKGPASLRDAQKRDEKALDGKVDDCLPEVFKRPPAAESGDQCYDFDQDMLRSTGAGEKGTADGMDKAGKNACLVTFAKGKVRKVEDIVDRATGVVQAMLCQSKKGDDAFALPALGERKDLAPAFKKAVGKRAKAVTSANIERLADVDGKPVFRSVVVMTDERGVTRETRLTHSQTGESKDGIGVYQGSLVSFTSSESADKKQVLTVRYLRSEKEGAVRMKYDLRMADVHKDVAEKAVNEDGVLDLNYGAEAAGERRHTLGGVAQNSNEVFSGIRQIGFDLDPSSGEGAFSYWQNPGGNFKEPARGMIFSLAKDTSGKLAGCATTGAASSSVRNFLADGTMGELAPKATFHPFLGDDANWQTVPLQSEGVDQTFQKGNVKVWLPRLSDATLAKEFATRQRANLVTFQCFVQGDAGTYAIDTTKIDEQAGYEVLRTEGNAADEGRLLPPPKLDDVQSLKRLPPPKK